ncbi:MiaB/RimO family radical SAM methylthiotransferase [Candidatus Gracilibacteria bacterium]|nr:MiaB/RimO family radical SAM methylthiotransferase [Candidatus Gracilibacteria bacterium]
MKTYYIKTFGCEMNHADSEKVNMILLQSGFKKVGNYKDADLIILNTCSVRQKGEDRVFGLLHEVEKINKIRLKEGKKEILTGLTGCMVRKTGLNKKHILGELNKKKAQNITYLENESGIFNFDDNLFSRLPNLDFTLRIEEIKYLNFILTHLYKERIGSDDKFDDYLKQVQLRENKYSATVIIQKGCDNFCTFCIVPYTRGREVSRSIEEIIEEIKELAKNGTKEITLVGQNVNSFGKQKNLKLWDEEKSKWNDGVGKSPFRELLEEINKIPGIDRVRFTSSNPHDMTQDILDAHFDLDNTCNYLHLALQSGNDRMLKKMNRKHSYKDFKDMVLYLREKDPFFTISTDIIVGYSSETESDFLDTINAIKELEIDFVYIARYSVRLGTIASKAFPDDVSDEIKADRWHRLNEVLEENVKKRSKKMIGRIEKILVSGVKDGYLFGRTRNFKEVFFDIVSGIKEGDIVDVEITEIDNWVLKGKILEQKK